MDSAFGVLAGILIGALIIMAIVAIISYVINGLFLTKIAKDNFVPNKWMAWVPGFQDFYIGYAAGVMTYDMNFSYIYIGGLISALIAIFVGEAMEVAFIAAIGMICIYVLSIMTIYKIFKTYFQESAIWLTVLGFLIPIALFVLKIIIITKKDFLPPIEKTE